MAKKDKQGNWLDARGKLVPEEYVPQDDKVRDALVTELHKEAMKLEELIIDFKMKAVTKIDAYLEELAKIKKVRENWKGNISLDSFDGSLRIERKIDETLGFDEKLQLVKTQVDKWVSVRLAGSDEALAKVISQAFNMDKQGKVNTSMLLKLLKLDIEDPEWKKAMRLLKESMSVRSSKQYINFKTKNSTDTGEDWSNVCLNFNSATVKDKE
jgi:hypothetical protein